MHVHPWLSNLRTRRTLIIIVAIAFVLFLLHEKQKQDRNGYSLTSGGSTGGMGYGADGEMAYDKDMALREEAAYYGRGVATMPSPMPPTMPGGNAPLTDVMQDDRYIVRNANVSAVVEDIQAASAGITAKTKELSGFITNSSVYNYDNRPSASLTVRVPVESFDAVLEYLRTSFRVTAENVSGDDVTEQVVDQEARLVVLKASEARFLEIMEDASEIEDVLNVQQQLERVRSEIDSLTSRLEYLKRSAALSTISISLTTEEEVLPINDPSKQWSPLATFKQAIRNAQDLIQGIADFFILNSLYIVGLGMCYVAYRLYRKIYG